RRADVDRVLSIYRLIQQYQGEDELELVIRSGSRLESVPLPNNRVGFCSGLEENLRGLLENGSVQVHELGVGGTAAAR
ncbi:MAG TPA: hypothetical protein VFA78_00705, partial [Chloroflexota bacterium]|nr:hypothetical protein [Chloroflexota bacterium]